MPHRSNRKGDLGNYRPESSAADIDNIFFTEEGWVYRHFKGDPRDPNTRFWDEIIVAGEVDLDDTENGNPLETLSATPRHYLGLGSTDASNSVDGYESDGSGYATADIDFEEVFLPTGNSRVIGTTDKIFDVEYPKPGSGGGTPGGGCITDDDCGPDEICVNGKCEPSPVPDPILIEQVIVTSLSGAGGVSPDLGETHEYTFSITGNATDTQGIMRIEPVSAGTVVNNTVTWTDNVNAKVIFDVTSATAEDSPAIGELEVNVKTPPAGGDSYIGDVTITPVSGTTDVTKGMEYEYDVSFDGDVDPSTCYVTNTTGVVANITGGDTSLGVFRWKGKVGKSAADNFTLKLTVQSNVDVQEDDNNSEGELELTASADPWDEWGEIPAAEGTELSNWKSVAYGDGKFVAIAHAGDIPVMHSTDGKDWHPVAVEAHKWNSVTYGELPDGTKRFVVVGSGFKLPKAMTSDDGGETWTTHAETISGGYTAVTYGELPDGTKRFVAVSSDDGQSKVMTSPDGVTWTRYDKPQEDEQNAYHSVAYGNGKFVALAWSGDNRVMTSPDGVTWTDHAVTEENFWTSVTYGDGKFVAVGSDVDVARVMTSTDGETWTSHPAPDQSWRSVTYGNGRFVAVGNWSKRNAVMTSTDGVTWTDYASAPAGDWWSVTYGDGKFVAVAEGTKAGKPSVMVLDLSS
jgi:hypothetical protein